MKQNNNPDLLNVHDVLLVSYANGPGRRAVVWVQGCSKRCPGCSNPLTHSHRPNFLIAAERLAESITTIPRLDGLTVTGGEPCEQAVAVGYLCRIVREKGLSVMLYTGWEYEDICRSRNHVVRNLLKQIDILVDGPFVKKLADNSLLWRGSSNQQIRLLTDRYRPDVLETNNQPQVEGLLTADGRLQLIGFPDPHDMAAVSERLALKGGIVVEPDEVRL